jgi:hypothetical protein
MSGAMVPVPDENDWRADHSRPKLSLSVDDRQRAQRRMGRTGGAGATRQVVLVSCLRAGVPALRLQHMHNPPVAESLQPF